MSIFRRKIPPFIYKRSNLTLLVVFTSVFALLFINIYKPFESPQWYPITQFEYFLYSSLIILTGVLVVVISRIIMFYYTKKRTLTYWEYIIWVIGEIFFMSLFYTLYSYTLDETR
ncbi:MAG: LytTR family transcriptional regulator, partial [Bacteroidales bacterium]